MLPFPWLGRSIDSACTQDALAFHVLLANPIKSLSPALRQALPAPLEKARIAFAGPVLTVEGKQIKKAITATYKKSKTKSQPLQRFLDDVEAWLVKLHGEHAIALATVSWHPWIGPFGRPTPCEHHAAAVASPPWAALASLASLVDNSDAAKDTRTFVTSTLAYLTDQPAVFERVVTDEALQRLFAHAWTTDENGTCLRMLALFVDDATLEAVAAVTPRLANLVRGRGFGAGDFHNVQMIATPSNVGWGVIARGRWFALGEPMKPSIRFDEKRETFVLTDDAWALEDTSDMPSVEVAAATCFSSRYSYLVEGGYPATTETEKRFVAMAGRAVRRVLRGRVENYLWVWEAPRAT